MKMVCKSVYVLRQEDGIVTPQMKGHTPLVTWVTAAKKMRALQPIDGRCVVWMHIEHLGRVDPVRNHVAVQLCLHFTSWETNSCAMNALYHDASIVGRCTPFAGQ